MLNFEKIHSYGSEEYDSPSPIQRRWPPIVLLLKRRPFQKSSKKPKHYSNMASPYRILFVIFAISVIHTCVNSREVKKRATYGNLQRISHTATNLTKEVSTVDDPRVVDCSVTGTWKIPYEGELTIAMSCHYDCSPVIGIEIPMLSLTHSYVGYLAISLHKDDRQVVIKGQEEYSNGPPHYDKIYIEDVAEGGFLDTKFSFTISSPPSYLPREPLSQGFRGVQGCGEWIMNFTNPSGYSGLVKGIALRYITEP
ncbi:unnamed protein product [Cyprideis torosa]|uniref:Uncharacterized protein n=1 Tax=Cyprideis torosa TaxID=163714 RepID=A0A7R8WMH9_9CRUS|nr:unnamed protein product [Cyprideis torosa]CAG0899390.1 unnamed protein product [Cyprideis torosa]